MASQIGWQVPPQQIDRSTEKVALTVSAFGDLPACAPELAPQVSSECTRYQQFN